MPPAVVYLDTCAINRLTDDFNQIRVREEAAAMATVLDLIDRQQVRWIASAVLQFEIDRNPDTTKRGRAISVLNGASEVVTPDEAMLKRASELALSGYIGFDALHLAVAALSGVEWFLTTDDRLLRRAAAHPPAPHLVVLNPVDWLRRRHLWLVP